MIMISVYQLIKHYRLRIIMALGFLLLCFSNTCWADTVYVAVGGSQLANGLPINPVPSVKAGICRAGSGDTIEIGGGVYNEALIINKRVTLIAPGGPATIVGNAGKRLKVLTYNTHLFGDTLGPDFEDDRRAVQIADKISAEDADIVALQELWDGDLVDKIISKIEDIYYYHWTGETDEIDDVLGAGLMLLSKYPINVKVVHYENESSFLDGFDAWASKGHMHTFIDVDGFPLYVFNTHLDASGKALEQVEELGAYIYWTRFPTPGHGIIVMGDFNLPKDYSPLSNHVSPYFAILDSLGVFDAFSAGCCEEVCNAYTDVPDNELRKIFNPDNEISQTIDYILYSNGIGFNMVPLSASVKKYKASSPISDGEKSSRDLSDHYGIVVEFSLTR